MVQDQLRDIILVVEAGKVIWYCSKIRGTFSKVPIIRIIVFWGLYWGPLIQGNYHILLMEYFTILQDDILSHPLLGSIVKMPPISKALRRHP